MARFPDPEKIRSHDQLVKLYLRCRSELEGSKKASSAANVVSKQFRNERDELRASYKRVRADVVTLTRKQKAASEANKAGMWSGGAAVATTILYEVWKVIGFPGGKDWADFWVHEAPYGVIMWMMTCAFAFAYKQSHNGQ